MNMPVPTSPQLPAHLMDFGVAANIGVSAIGGINIGQSHPRISIKQNRFRLMDSQDQQTLVPNLHLDVIIIGANDYVSKLYYAQAFDPADPEPPAPTCFSDNGTAPSDRAVTPQCTTCAACPHAAWGSKVTPSGTKVKACSDSKKLAVVLADNPTGLVYELRVPAASMENLKAFVDTYVKPQSPLPSYVIRMTFDANSNYPKLLFQPAAYITPEQKSAVLEVIGGEEFEEAVGKNDKARDPNQPLLAAPQATPVPAVNAGYVPPASFTTAAPMPMPQAPQFAPAPVQQPVPVAPTFAPQPGAFVPAQDQPTQAPAKRARRTKAQIAAEAAGVNPTVMPPPGQQFTQSSPAVMAPQPMQTFQVAQPAAVEPLGMPPIPAFLNRDVPNAQPAAASVPLQPQPTDAALDNLLMNAMRK